MKNIKISKKEENNQLVVDVELPERQFGNDPIQVFSNTELLAYLSEEGIKLSEYKEAASPSRPLTSYSTKGGYAPRLAGTWIFEKKEVKVEKVQVEKKVEKKMNKRTTKTSNKKMGD